MAAILSQLTDSNIILLTADHVACYSSNCSEVVGVGVGRASEVVHLFLLRKSSTSTANCNRVCFGWKVVMSNIHKQFNYLVMIVA